MVEQSKKLMYYAYILQSLKDKRFYHGMTKDLSQRVQEHNSGQVKSTKARTPFNLLYHEAFETLREAREREKFFKTGAGRVFRDRVIKNIPR